MDEQSDSWKDSTYRGQHKHTHTHKSIHTYMPKIVIWTYHPSVQSTDHTFDHVTTVISSLNVSDVTSFISTDSDHLHNHQNFNIASKYTFYFSIDDHLHWSIYVTWTDASHCITLPIKLLNSTTTYSFLPVCLGILEAGFKTSYLRVHCVQLRFFTRSLHRVPEFLSQFFLEISKINCLHYDCCKQSATVRYLWQLSMHDKILDQ